MISFTCVSCVSIKKYEELQASHEKLKATNSKQENELAELQQQKKQLEQAKASLEEAKKQLAEEKEKLALLVEELGRSQQRAQSSYRQETGILQEQIEEARKALDEKEKELQKRTASLGKLEDEFKASKARLMELEQMLVLKDSTTNALRKKVENALLGFEGKGLSVTKKNGKVYVSLDEKLLFKSGSYAVEKRGVEALCELAKVLEVNSDINIMVEGHTDDVPYRGTAGLKDNWDLSVKRATTVVRTLLESAPIDPMRVVASGRSQYLPIDDAKTSEARQKNRRTEIILSPKLDELLELLENR